MTDGSFRLLICGGRSFPWPRVVHEACDHFHRLHGDRLVVIEGGARGADRAAHGWCKAHGLRLGERHLYFPVDWEAEKARRPDWRRAGNERNTMMLKERPHQVVGFHDGFEYERGGTSDMLLKSLLCGVPTWLIPGNGLTNGHKPDIEKYPERRRQQARRDLQAAGLAARQEYEEEGLWAD